MPSSKKNNSSNNVILTKSTYLNKLNSDSFETSDEIKNSKLNSNSFDNSTNSSSYSFNSNSELLKNKNSKSNNSNTKVSSTKTPAINAISNSNLHDYSANPNKTSITYVEPYENQKGNLNETKNNDQIISMNKFIKLNDKENSNEHYSYENEGFDLNEKNNYTNINHNSDINEITVFDEKILDKLNETSANNKNMSPTSNNTYTSILMNQNRNNLYNLTKKNESYADIKNSNIPKRVTLSWTSLTIKADVRSLLDKALAMANLVKKKRSEVILNKVHGIVEPGQMLALMGPR